MTDHWSIEERFKRAAQRRKDYLVKGDTASAEIELKVINQMLDSR